MRQTCTEPGCDRPIVGRGLCNRHYQNARNHGTLPEKPPDRVCEQCGKEITARKWNARYCSRRCNDTANRGRHLRYRVLASDRTEDRECRMCGGVIPAAATLKMKCCSRECNVAWQNEKRAADRLAAWAAEDPRCARCGEPIPVPEKGHHRMKYCSAACKKKDADARWRASAPGYNRQYLYGISPEQYEAMMAGQGGRCAICGTTEWKGKTDRPHTDHDHVTGIFRGILCDSCNLGIGKFGDDPVRLRAAADYLERAMTVPA